MKKAMIAMVFLAGGLFAAPRVTFGIGINVPAPVAYRPACPGPGYTWVNGYETNRGWVNGYWAAPVQVAPRYSYDRDYDHDRYRRDFDHDRDRDHDRRDDRFRR